SLYSPRVLIERFEEGPFRMVHYQLSPDGKQVDAVLATFVPGYAVDERRAALEEAIAIRLGAGENLQMHHYLGKYSGMQWRLLSYRVDLRFDEMTGQLELLFHRRGRVDPTADFEAPPVVTPVTP
ncbi:MAG: hypothetical protein KC620_05640, partial [Myxococcales bacterium]|nr:hypothetical protein [Myxococcales bacterium]